VHSPMSALGQKQTSSQPASLCFRPAVLPLGTTEKRRGQLNTVGLVSSLLFERGPIRICRGIAPNRSPYELRFGTFRDKPLGMIVYTPFGSDPAPGQTMELGRARWLPIEPLVTACGSPRCWNVFHATSFIDLQTVGCDDHHTRIFPRKRTFAVHKLMSASGQ
jgi:hypothetical protein